MSDPALALQGAIVSRLKADQQIQTLVGNRVHDRVPADATFPYVAVGDMQSIDAGADCVDALDVIVTIHAWSRAVGQIECKRVASAVRAALHEADLVVPGFQFLDVLHQDTRHVGDPDGITSHAVITLRAQTALA